MHETNSKHRKSKLPTFLACLSHPCRRLQSQYLRQITTTGFVRRFQGATFSRENIPLKTFTKMFFDLLLWQENHNAITVKKTAINFFHLNRHFCLRANDIARNRSRVIFSRACADIFRRWTRRRNLLVALAQYTVTHFRSSSTKPSSWFLSSLISP